MKHPVVALSFGKGKANKYIARTVKQYEGRTLILQKEIAFFFRCKSILKHRCPGQYLDTYEVLSQAKEYLCETPTIILIAHPDHLPRATRIAKMIGFNVIAVPSARVYDKEDEQWWVRSRIRFFLWNTIANLLLWRKNTKCL